MRMKKLLSLLFLTLVSTASAWAEDEVLFSANPTNAWSVPADTTDAEITSSYATITGGKMYVTNNQTSAKDLIKKQSEMAFQQTNNDTFFKVVLNKALQAGDIISTRMQSRTDTDLGLWMSTATPRPSEEPTSKIVLPKASSQSWVAVTAYTVAEGDGICGETTFYIYRHTGKSTYFNTFTITRPIAGDAPQFTIGSTANIKATKSGVAATTDIAIVGANLTGSTVTATLSPAVAGLSVELASDAIADGAISTTATLSYTATENANGSTTLTITDGTTSKDVTVSYKAKVIATPLQSICEATTWDFNNGVTYSGSTDYAMDDKEVETVYADYDELTYNTDFNAGALAFKGEYPFRSNSKKFAQNGTLRFNTTVPGTIVVNFSDTGSGASATAEKRYLVVNGETTEYWTSRENNGESPYAALLNVTTEEIPVAAGDVTISGTSAITVSKITFTPTTGESVTVSAAGYATFSSDLALDFSSSAIKAYVATVSGTDITFTKINKVPASTGVLLYAEGGATETIPVAAEVDDASGNAFVATTAALDGAALTAAGAYILAKVDGAIGFYRAGSGASLAAGKAYLVSPTDARISLPGGETTAISTIETVEAGAAVYNVSGQRVQKTVKGLYIVNGKKLMVK